MGNLQVGIVVQRNRRNAAAYQTRRRTQEAARRLSCAACSDRAGAGLAATAPSADVATGRGRARPIDKEDIAVNERTLHVNVLRIAAASVVWRPSHHFLANAHARPRLGHDARTGLADAIADVTLNETDAFLVFRDDLPAGERVAQALVDGFGAEEDDEVIEVRRRTGRRNRRSALAHRRPVDPAVDCGLNLNQRQRLSLVFSGQ